MVKNYTILIENKSGRDLDYALFNNAPAFTGQVEPEVFSNVFATAMVPDGSSSKIDVTDNYFAVVGISQGAPGHQVTVDVSQSREVTLGKRYDDGTVVHGTSVQMEVNGEEGPVFSDERLEDAGAGQGFAITTPHFELRDALRGNWLIGLGGADRSGRGLKAPAAVFRPEPRVTYNIQPSLRYTLTPEQYEEGAIIDVRKVGNSIDIDFQNFPTSVIKIVHNSNGRLSIKS